MHMPDRALAQSWQILVQQSAELRAAVDEQDWMHASDVAEQRHTSVQKHFEQFPVGPDTAGFYRQNLAHLLADEPQLHALAVQARREVMKQGLAFNHSRRAVNMYQGK